MKSILLVIYIYHFLSNDFHDLFSCLLIFISFLIWKSVFYYVIDSFVIIVFSFHFYNSLGLSFLSSQVVEPPAASLYFPWVLTILLRGIPFCKQSIH